MVRKVQRRSAGTKDNQDETVEAATPRQKVGWHMTKRVTKSNKDQFIAAAKAAEVDEDETRWEQRLKAVAKPPPKPKKGK